MPKAVDFVARPYREDLQDLKNTVCRLMEETGRSASDAVTYAGVYVAQSGRAGCRLGKRVRKVIDNPEYKRK